MNISRCARRVHNLFWFAALAVLSACSGGGDDATPAVAPVAQPATLVSTPDKSYSALKGNSGAALEYFRKSDGQVAQASYTSPTTHQVTRVIYDADGLPERIVDTGTGQSVVITRVSANRTDFRTYTSQGDYVSGYSILNQSGLLSSAPILGTPSFSGQLSGQIQGTSQTGSFTILPADGAGLGPITPISAATLALADIVIAGPTAAGRVLPQAFSARARIQAVAAVDGRAVAIGLIFGAAVGASSANPAAALIAGAMMAYGLQNYLLPIFDGISKANSLESLPDALAPLLNGVNGDVRPSDALQAALAGGAAPSLKDFVDRVFDAAKDVLGSVVDVSTLPALTGSGVPVDTHVSGVGVDQQGIGYTYSGLVTPAGSVNLTGTASDGGQGIDASGTIGNGNLTGTTSGRLGAGTISGSVSNLGQCAQLTQSGGQGTFSYAFDAVATSGTVTFFRDAFTIPDGFRVQSGGAVLYDTGGLVSGSETIDLQLNGSRTLFVTVNAPNSGTAWNLNLGCPV